MAKPGAKLGSDSCYSRSDNSSTDSEAAPPRTAPPPACRAPARGDISCSLPHAEAAAAAAQQRLERLCPRVTAGRAAPCYTDTTSLSSVDTSSSSSDLWNVRAMPDPVQVTRLNTRPISLRAGPARSSHARPSPLDTLTDELLTRVLSYLTTRQVWQQREIVGHR